MFEVGLGRWACIPARIETFPLVEDRWEVTTAPVLTCYYLFGRKKHECCSANMCGRRLRPNSVQIFGNLKDVLHILLSVTRFKTVSMSVSLPIPNEWVSSILILVTLHFSYMCSRFLDANRCLLDFECVDVIIWVWMFATCRTKLLSTHFMFWYTILEYNFYYR